MRILIDTNILLRLAEASHPLHLQVSETIKQLHRNGGEFVLVPQVIYEFWTVVTRTVPANGLGKTPEFAQKEIERFCQLFQLLRDERAIYETWLKLVSSHGITGVNAFDTRLVAAMNRHGITTILTLNSKDFKRYQNITIIDPLTSIPTT